MHWNLACRTSRYSDKILAVFQNLFAVSKVISLINPCWQILTLLHSFRHEGMIVLRARLGVRLIALRAHWVILDYFISLHLTLEPICVWNLCRGSNSRDHGSKTQPFNWWTDSPPLCYCRLGLLFCFVFRVATLSVLALLCVYTLHWHTGFFVLLHKHLFTVRVLARRVARMAMGAIGPPIQKLNQNFSDSSSFWCVSQTHT